MRTRIIVAAGIVLMSIMPQAFADTTSGKVVRIDKVAKTIVLSDRTVWTTKGSEKAVPDQLKEGDAVEIVFDSGGDDGVRSIKEIKILSN